MGQLDLFQCRKFVRKVTGSAQKQPCPFAARRKLCSQVSTARCRSESGLLIATLREMCHNQTGTFGTEKEHSLSRRIAMCDPNQYMGGNGTFQHNAESCTETGAHASLMIMMLEIGPLEYDLLLLNI